MTKPIVSVGIMMLLEEGHLLLADPVAKFIPEFSNLRVGVESDGKLHLVPLQRPMTIQDLLRHTSGLTTDNTGNGLVQQLYQQSDLRNRKNSNAAFVKLIAELPLICQPGAEWNYSRSTDVLGRIIEIVSGKSLGAFLTERILAPLQMTETGFSTGEENAGRIAEPFPTDPWSGAEVKFFNPLEKPVMESGGGGLVSTTMDYARFSQMLLNGGTLDGKRLLGPKTVAYMTSDHLGTAVVPGPYYLPGAGYGFGLGFAVRRDAGVSPVNSSPGEYNWGGVGGTAFWVDPKEDMLVVYMMQSPSKRTHYRALLRDMIYAAILK
jgi:CubicO group peptidase (beta-lactamase class C family)